VREKDLKLKILYDNNALEGFREGYGFSCLIEEKKILFDTGGDVATLLHNMRKFMVNLSDIKKIILSHEHGDHTGGLRILDHCGEVEVYVPISFSSRLKHKLASYSNVTLKQVSAPQEICEGLLTTGELGKITKEQSLTVKTDNGLTLITGCAHPGLENILLVASKFGEISAVVGGFHGFDKLEGLKKLRLIVPCHCTTHKREILSLYPESSIECSAGVTIEI
jgi:7,8-dihydropterin-6-yl-methyl-4-(beta-D-ribofuranosyl)aminobenzene 5'-phosphate synthase